MNDTTSSSTPATTPINDEVLASRRTISRRRALGFGGAIAFTSLLAACSPRTSETLPTDSTGEEISPTTSADADIVAKLDGAASCGSFTQEVTQGPYYFDVDSIRSDLREDRPGTTLQVAFRVWDENCDPIPNSVVEIWHCDAGGIYSGFEVASSGANSGGAGQDGGPGGGPGGGQGGGTSSGQVSDGSYSSGVSEASPTDDGTYLRGAQVADANGVVQFTTIWPGWYVSRTVHIHLKVHVDRGNVLTAQVGFDDDLNDAIFRSSPYSDHPGRDTYNGGDAGNGNDNIITSREQLLTVEETSDGYLGYLNLQVRAA